MCLYIYIRLLLLLRLLRPTNITFHRFSSHATHGMWHANADTMVLTKIRQRIFARVQRHTAHTHAHTRTHIACFNAIFSIPLCPLCFFYSIYVCLISHCMCLHRRTHISTHITQHDSEMTFSRRLAFWALHWCEESNNCYFLWNFTLTFRFSSSKVVRTQTEALTARRIEIFCTLSIVDMHCSRTALPFQHWSPFSSEQIVY